MFSANPEKKTASFDVLLALLKTLLWFLAQNLVIKDDFREIPLIDTFSNDSDTK